MVLMKPFAGQQWRCRHIERTCGSREKGGMCWESSTGLYTPQCVKSMASGSLLCSTGRLPPYCVMTKKGGMGVREGSSKGRGYMYAYSKFTLLYNRK